MFTDDFPFSLKKKTTQGYQWPGSRHKVARSQGDGSFRGSSPHHGEWIIVIIVEHEKYIEPDNGHRPRGKILNPSQIIGERFHELFGFVWKFGKQLRTPTLNESSSCGSSTMAITRGYILLLEQPWFHHLTEYDLILFTLISSVILCQELP